MNPYFRLAKIISITVFSACKFWVCRLLKKDTDQVLLRYFLKCGGAYIKIGQILAIRYDLLPVATCEALSKLLSNLPAEPFEATRQKLTQYYGTQYQQIFIELDERPIQCASIAQLYKARLVSGEQVVLKVKKKHIEKLFLKDIESAVLMAKVIDFLGVIKNFSLQSLIAEIKYFLLEEIDFVKEARNTDLMHRLMLQDRHVHYAPKVFSLYCNNDILVEEYIEGLSLVDLMKVSDVNEVSKAESQKIAFKLFESVVIQCFENKIFHADPHPANIILRPDGSLGFVDFGTIGRLSNKLHDIHISITEAIAHEDTDAMFNNFVPLLKAGRQGNLPEFEHAFKRLANEWIVVTNHPFSSVKEKSSGLFFLQVLNLIRQHGFKMDLQSLLLFKNFIMSDMIILKLYPEFNKITPLKQYFPGFYARLIRSEHSVQKLITNTRTLAKLFRDAPDTLSRINTFISDQSPQLGMFSKNISIVENVFITGIKLVNTLLAFALVYIIGAKIISVSNISEAICSSEYVRFVERYDNFQLAASVLLLMIVRISTSKLLLNYK